MSDTPSGSSIVVKALIVTDNKERAKSIQQVFDTVSSQEIKVEIVKHTQIVSGSFNWGEYAAAIVDFEGKNNEAIDVVAEIRNATDDLAIAVMAPTNKFPIPVDIVAFDIDQLVISDDEGIESLPTLVRVLQEDGYDKTSSSDLKLRNQELREITDSLARQSVHLIRLRNDLAAEKSKFETVVNGAADGIIFFNTSGSFELMNPVAKEALASFADPTKTRMNNTLKLLMSRKVGDSRGDEDEFEVLLDEKFYRIRTNLVVGSDGKKAGALLSMVDVTRVKEYERLKDDFTSMISHELRTPLTSIRSAVDNFIRGNLGEVSEKQKKFLHMIARNVDRQQALINDLLDMAKFEAGQMEVRLDKSSLSLTAQNSFEQFVLSFSDKGIKAELKKADNLVEFLFDSRLISQALINLLSNALKFTEAGGSVTMGVEQKSGLKIPLATVWVENSGIGISKGEQVNIFDKYTQVDSSERRRYGGTGLGLSIVREVARAHNGDVTVESETGKGSRFTISLPMK